MLSNASYVDDHKTFGGIIYQSDFNTDYRGKNSYKGSVIAQRIMSDRRFDEQCRKNMEGRDRHGYEWNNTELDGDCVEEIVEPSWYISEEMKRLSLTSGEFAIRLGISNGQMRQLLSGKLRITERIARKLERETGKSRDYWLDLQNEYDFERDLERGMAVSV